MDLAAVFLLSVLGGYGFASLWRYTSYEIRRTDGHHLYFRAAFYGAVFFAATFMLRIIALAYWPWFEGWDSAAQHLIEPALKEPHNARQSQLVITAACSMFVGPIFAVALNLVTPKRWSLRRSVSALDELLLRAQYAEIPVSVTLNTGKIYIGLVRKITDTNHPLPSIVLFPMLSGHRNENGVVELTTNYERLYSTLDAKDSTAREKHKLPKEWEPYFEVVIRADTIVSANIFSPSVYSEFNPGWQKNIEPAAGASPRQELLVEIKKSSKKPWKR